MRDNFILRRLTDKDERAFHVGLESLEGLPLFHFAQSYRRAMTFSEYLKLLSDNEKGIRLPDGLVPYTMLFGFANKEIIGGLIVRHRLNDFYLSYGGHIGYGVLPKSRGQKYARRMLCLAQPLIEFQRISKLLIICDDENINSIKTIEAFDAVLENRIRDSSEKLLRRYWIDPKNLC